MAYAISKKYTYMDARDGTVYEAHTCSDADEEDRPSGDDLRFALEMGGDQTVSDSNRHTKRVLGIGALGSGYGAS